MKRTANRISLSFFLVSSMLACCFACHSQEINFTAQTDNNIVSINDTINLSYSITCYNNNQAPTKFIPSLGDMIVVSGPVQNQNLSFTYINNKPVKVFNYIIEYRLRARDTGNILLPPALIKTTEKDSVTSNPLEILVINETTDKGSRMKQNKWPSSKTGIFAKNLADKKKDYQYILTVGPIYLSRYNFAKTFANEVGILINSVDSAIETSRKCKKIATAQLNNLPRSYYLLNDTTHIRNILQSVYSKSKLNAEFHTCISILSEWDNDIEIDQIRVMRRELVRSELIRPVNAK